MLNRYLCHRADGLARCGTDGSDFDCPVFSPDLLDAQAPAGSESRDSVAWASSPSQRPLAAWPVTLMDEAGLTIIVQRPWMDNHDSLARHHVLDLQGRKRGVQALEIGEIFEPMRSGRLYGMADCTLARRVSGPHASS